MDENLRTYVLLRDGGCCARFVNSEFHAARWPMLQNLPAPGVCRNAFGSPADPESLLGMTLDHVKTELAMGKKAPDDADHLWTLCHWHHVNTSWATNAEVRAAARLYIVAANAVANKRGWPRLNTGRRGSVVVEDSGG